MADFAPLPPDALYVHLPFCISQCPYCDFVVYSGALARGPRARTERLYAAVEQELELRADALDRAFGAPAGKAQAGTAQAGTPQAGTQPGNRPPLASLYFGGGTPSLVPGEWLERLVAVVRRRYGLAPGAEVTLEANPGPDERGDAAAFAAAGVNRVSYGAQSLDPGELKRLGRRHSPQDVAAAVAEARSAGIVSVNLDLLYDVPGQTIGSWGSSLGGALELAPDHLSLYALTLDDPEAEGLTGERGDHLPTPRGARRWRERAAAEQDDDRAAAEYELAYELLAAGGWRGYEISNWARPGHESRHNLAYWLRRPYEAVGPGAHAFDGRSRRWNAAPMDPYLASLLPPSGPAQLPPGGGEDISDAAARSERLILALRLDTGVAADSLAPEVLETFERADLDGLIEPFVMDGEPRRRLTVRGRLLSNDLFARLI